MATIVDVAKAAGVSVSTVSYALSGRRPISAATRERIHAAIDELGYRPHAGARSLASRQTRVMALAAPLRTDLYVPVIMQFVAAVATAARAHDHDVLLLMNDEGPAGLERVAGGSMVDAFVVMDVATNDPRLSVLRRLREPTVLIGLPARADGLSCVDLDWEATGRLAVQQLVDHGHTAVALIGPPPAAYERGTTYAHRFRTGFEVAAAEAGIRSLAVPCESSHDGLAASLARVDTEQPDTTGFVVHNEPVAGTLLHALRASGREVPQDASVVAVGPHELAEGPAVRLTSIGIPADEIGALAVEMAADLLAGRSPQTRLVAPRLVERDSCGPARA
ncbi:MAG: LacI family transcriptional regulator [Actinomycetota bacterium]|nr:LacI family transcriptional regulator [Actinomycetota bacterium]